MNITYDILAKRLMNMSEEQKKMNVTVLIDGEFYPIYDLFISDEKIDVLDKDHPYLMVR